MGANCSRERGDVRTRSVFHALPIPAADRARYEAYLSHMDSMRPLYRTGLPSLLRGMHEHGTWDIYLHFADWREVVTRDVVATLLRSVRSALRLWLSRLRGYNGFRRDRVRVRLFGIVLNDGVVSDATFDAAYGSKYPVVRHWRKSSEASPWALSEPGANLYSTSTALHSLRVVGNRSAEDATAYHPRRWSSPAFVHPEGCSGYQTKLWLSDSGRWRATAQRHYVFLDSVIASPASGDIGNRFSVLLHEMGHCFFLDDMYDARKFPSPLPSSGHRLLPTDTVMHSNRSLTPFDHAMLRHLWNASEPA